MDNLRGMMRWLSEKWRWVQAWWEQTSPDSAIKTNNPLLNDLVLNLIYGHLSFSDKKSFRLVCKIWLDASLGLWRKQSKFVIVKKGEITTPTDLVQNSTAEENKVTSFHLDFYKISDYPLLNLVYKIEDIPPIKLTHEDILRMMAERLLDDNWEPMQMSEGCTLQKENFIFLFQQILEDFPNLKVLSIELSQNPGDLGVFKESSERAQASILETLQFTSWNSKIDVEEASRILNLIPNIKNLHLKGSVCESFLQALKSPLTSGKHILLERLKINYPHTLRRGFLLPERSHLLLRDYLNAACPPLKTLKASFLDHFIEPMKMPISIISGMELYREVVSKVENTLTCLDFRVTIQSQVWFIALAGCSLPNLTRFFVRFRDMCENDSALIKFDFGTLRGTPRLKVLHLDIEWICDEYVSERTFGTILEANELEYKGKTGKWLPSPILLEYLEDFRFEMYHKPTEGCWMALAEMMPNVKKVQAIFDEETLSLVLELWPELTHCFLSQHSSVSDKLKMKRKWEKATEIKFGEPCKEEDWDKW